MCRSSLTLLATLVLAGTASADMIAPNPTPLRLALAPVALVGKVTRIEEKSIPATRFPGDMQKVPFVVAVVKIETGLVGTDKQTHVRVGFPRLAPAPVGLPGTGRPIPLRRPGMTLEKDQEVLLFLRPHEDAGFLMAADPFGFVIGGGNPNFKTEVADVVRTAKLLADPRPVLTGTDREARALVAALLIHRYRSGLQGKSKQEAIPAEESKLLLTALAEADWNPNRAGQGRYFQLAPLQTFFRLGLTEADGWKPPKDFNQFPQAAQKWLTDHSGTYRLQRIVPETR